MQNLSSRIEATEHKVEQTISRAKQKTDRIQDLQDQLDTAISKIDDLENRSRHYNFHIRGLPETVKDTHLAVRSFIKDIIPDHRLELDRAHRALHPPCSDGLLGDIVVKPHFYGVKEEVMRIARDVEQLSIQRHPVQVFADLSPLTIQWRRALKPLLQVLSQKMIKYWWSFPFRLSFTYKNKTHGFTSINDGECLMVHLGLISLDPSTSSTHKNTGSTDYPSTQSPITPVWRKQQSKRSKDSHPP